jgi:hypothetical protein
MEKSPSEFEIHTTGSVSGSVSGSVEGDATLGLLGPLGLLGLPAVGEEAGSFPAVFESVEGDVALGLLGLPAVGEDAGEFPPVFESVEGDVSLGLLGLFAPLGDPPVYNKLVVGL